MGCRFADTEIGHVHELSPQRLVRTATERRALRLRPSEPVLRAFPQPLALEFGHGRENAEQHAPVRAGRVNAIARRHEIDAERAQFVGKIHHMPQAAPKPTA